MATWRSHVDNDIPAASADAFQAFLSSSVANTFMMASRLSPSAFRRTTECATSGFGLAGLFAAMT
jgi:hypothetical protein